MRYSHFTSKLNLSASLVSCKKHPNNSRIIALILGTTKIMVHIIILLIISVMVIQAITAVQTAPILVCTIMITKVNRRLAQA